MAGLRKRRRLDPVGEANVLEVVTDHYRPCISFGPALAVRTTVNVIKPLQGASGDNPADPKGDVDELGEAAFLTDTMAAILMLRGQYPPAARTAALILRSQIYTVVKDRTVVDRDLEKHRQDSSLRLIKLPASVDDYAYILREDYYSSIEAAYESEKAKSCCNLDLVIFQRFKERVLSRWREAVISHSQLMALLSEAPAPRQGVAPECTVTDRQLSLLLSNGLLTRQVGSQSSYLFAVAGAGRMVTSITKGRKEILGALSRKRHKEAFLKDLEKMKLKESCLDMQWHLRDLLGRGSVIQVSSPSGAIIRQYRKEQ